MKHHAEKVVEGTTDLYTRQEFDPWAAAFEAALDADGTIASVVGTPFDLRTARSLEAGWDADHPQIRQGGGYDHNWALDTEFGKVEKIAQVEDEKAGRIMDVYTDLPGVQFYAGNCITPQTGKGGAAYGKRHALCLETQYFPNSINTPEFRQPVFDAGQPYHTTTVYKFR